jgi:hypothetical protein
MNENTYYRRSLIKRGLTLFGGIFFMGAIRSSFGTPNREELAKRTKNPRRGPSMTQHCIEGISLALPVNHLESNKE